MDKSAATANYPRMPNEMSEATTHIDYNAAAPPSYDQAMHTATPYPPADAMKQPHTQQPKANGMQYGATNIGGSGGAGGGIPPPQHAYMSNAASQSMGAQQQPPVIIIQQHAILPLGPDPAIITCPACHMTKQTRIDYEPNARTHLMAAILCIVGLWCCVCLPYCAESCMNTNHYCGNCNKFLGTYNGGGF